MELYFDRPSLTRVFYYPDRTDYLTLHTHDMDRTLIRPRVIYLYRDPVDTVYSQIRYENESPLDRDSVEMWAEDYARHLDKWLCREDFSERKTVLTYEAMRRDLPSEFRKVCAHFGEGFSPERVAAVGDRVTKERTRQKNVWNQRVVNLSDDYNRMRQQFREEMAPVVWDILLRGRPHLRQLFPDGAAVPTTSEIVR